MSDLIVKYANSLNTISFRNFTAVEFDLFMTICANLKNKGCDEVVFDFDKLKQLSKYQSKDIQRFADDLQKTYKKLINLDYYYEDEHKIVNFVFFTGYEVDKDNKTVKIEVNKKFKDILNTLSTQFTRFELQEFTNLKSTYSKSIYRLLKQYKTTGKREFSIDEFRHLLDVPNSYRMRDIDKTILQPSLKELKKYLPGIKIKKTYASTKGRPVKSIIYTFKAENNFDRLQKQNSKKETTGKDKDELYINEMKNDIDQKEVIKIQQSFIDVLNDN